MVEVELPWHCVNLKAVSHRFYSILSNFRSDKLVTMLRSRGFRASRTHFDPTAIRTDANIKQMRQVMGKEPVNR